MKSTKNESVRSVKSIRSIRSIRSVKSLKTINSAGDDSEEYIPTFEEVLPLACKKYDCPYSINVRKEYQQDEFYKQLKAPEPSVKYKKISVAVPLLHTISQNNLDKQDDKYTATTPSELSIDEDALNITSIYDNTNNLTEIRLNKVNKVPRSLIQIILYLAPSYEHLSKITINQSTIENCIIHELSKMLHMTSITDLCLDGSTLACGDYFMFLDHKNIRIKYLSVSRCGITDEQCLTIAKRLHFLCPAEKTLLLLNLSSNHITDEGVKHLGEALRTNRHLRYLNLADNRICDDGASSILSSLVDFPLTYFEAVDRKRRLMEYLRSKRAIVLKYLNEFDSKSPEECSQFSRSTGNKNKRTSATNMKYKSNKKVSKRDKQGDDNIVKAELIANEILGLFCDPFAPNTIQLKETFCHSLGNFVLCYLNLSYNYLSYLSIKKILAVLQYQRINKILGQSGLIKIVIEGNAIPTNCIEYHNLNELTRLAKGLQHFGGRASDAGIRTKRSTRISIVSPSPLNTGRK